MVTFFFCLVNYYKLLEDAHFGEFRAGYYQIIFKHLPPKDLPL